MTNAELNDTTPSPPPLSPKGERGETIGVHALSPLGERVSVSRRTGEGGGPSRYYATQFGSGSDSNVQEV